MSWAKFDDRFHHNAKIIGISHPAFRLYVCAITHCRAHGATGVIPAAALQGLARMHRVNLRAAAAELVAAGLFEDETEVGYEIHNYSAYGPSQTSDAIRNLRSEAGKRGARVRWMANEPSEDGKPDGKPVAPQNAPVPSRPDLALNRAPKGASAVATAGPVERIFEHYRQGTGHTRATLSDPARKIIWARLKQGYPEERLIAACYGHRFDDWEGRPQNTSLEDIMRPRNIENFATWQEQGGQPRALTAADRWAQRSDDAAG